MIVKLSVCLSGFIFTSIVCHIKSGPFDPLLTEKYYAWMSF